MRPPPITRVAVLALAIVGLTTARVSAQADGALPACVIPAGVAVQGRITATYPLADGSILVDATTQRELTLVHDWQRFDPATRRMTSAGETRSEAPGGVHGQDFPLPQGTRLMQIGGQRLVYDPSLQRVVPLAIPGFGIVDRVFELPEAKGALVMLSGTPHHYKSRDRIDPISLRNAGAILATGLLPNNRGVFINAERGLYRFDGSLAPIVNGPAAVESLADGLLIHSTRGWFRYDAPSNTVVSAGSTDASDPLAIADYAGGGKLIRTAVGWFRYDPGRKTVLLLVKDKPVVSEQHHVARAPNGDPVMAFYDQVYTYSPAAPDSTQPLVYGVGSAVSAMHPVSDGVLVVANLGLFHLDTARRLLRPMQNVELGGASIVRPLSNGATLIVANQGVFRYERQTRRIDVLHASGLYVGATHALPNGDVLVYELDGNWVRYDAASGRVVPAGRGAPNKRLTWHDLPGGGVLIDTGTALLAFDPRTAMVEPVRGEPTGTAYKLLPLRGGDVLVQADKGLFIAPAPRLGQAKVRPLRPDRFDRDAASRDSVEMVVAFEHPCAPVADRLGLEIELTLNGQTGARVPVRIPFSETPTALVAPLAASFVFDRPGTGTLQLRQGSQAIGPALPFTVAGPSLVQRLAAAWKWVTGIAVALLAAAFAALVVLAHKSTTAFRLLSDAAWAKWLTWPFFFLRHVAAVQRWILEPWFQAVRRATTTDVQFLDPPAARDDLQVAASTLLARLRATRRLWLQGASGMGKSSVFAAWERAFFAAASTPGLAAAVRAHGFVLVPLRLRDYAGLMPPNAHRPESWLIEAVRRRFEQSGFPTRDPELIAAMLMTGHFALALDGMNETAHDTAIDAFATQFPMVPMLVTSQARGGDGWETWRLPADIRGLSTGLLGLWLGPERGETLARRIAAAGLSDSIVSGYDLRLLADLAGGDPRHADLPADRIALYRAMLAHAADLASEPLHLEGLKRLAWSLLAEHHRRELLPEDVTVLGTGTLQALAREGVRIVRQRGGAYEFRHDQMRAFLAALWLTEETPGPAALQAALLDAGIFGLSRLDQEGLWSFVAPLLDDDGLVSLWRFASADPESRSILLAALQRDADRRGLQLLRPASDRASSKSPAASPDPADC